MFWECELSIGNIGGMSSDACKSGIRCRTHRKRGLTNSKVQTEEEGGKKTKEINQSKTQLKKYMKENKTDIRCRICERKEWKHKAKISQNCEAAI